MVAVGAAGAHCPCPSAVPAASQRGSCLQHSNGGGPSRPRGLLLCGSQRRVLDLREVWSLVATVFGVGLPASERRYKSVRGATHCNVAGLSKVARRLWSHPDSSHSWALANGPCTGAMLVLHRLNWLCTEAQHRAELTLQPCSPPLPGTMSFGMLTATLTATCIGHDRAGLATFSCCSRLLS